MKTRSGFTIVELLVVIVVIAILAAITIVAYNGIQQRARDAQRRSDFATLEKALRLYRIDNNGFPQCAASGAFTAGVDSANTCLLSVISAQLVPKYIGSLPKDPANTGSYQYRYAVGYGKASGSCTLSYLPSQDAYLLGTKLESTSTGACAGYWGFDDINLIAAGSGS
jgi:type II secretion system protein G